MSKITLNVIFNELQKTNTRLDKIEAKDDDRFQLIKHEFQIVHGRLDGIDMRLDGIDMRLDRMEPTLNATYAQTARTVGDVIELKDRLSVVEKQI